MNNKSITVSQSQSAIAWHRLKKNKLAMFGLIIIFAFIVIAMLGFLITPDSTPDANEQLLEISKQSPGFSVQMLLVRKNEEPHHVNFLTRMMYGQISDYRSVPIADYHFQASDIVYHEFSSAKKHIFFEKKINIADVAYALQDNTPVNYNQATQQLQFFEKGSNAPTIKTISEIQNLITQNNIKTRTFYLGTDPAGRDLLSRLMIGTRVSFSVGFISVFISLLIGVSLGSLAGYFRGRLDNIIIWIINVVWSIPTLLLVIAITLALGKGFWQVFVAVGLTMWVEVARVIRGQVMSLREKEFIEAARALGFSHFRIITRQILPNVMGPVIVISAANFASAILIEAGLSFLGIGAQPPTASWGQMINAHRGFIIGHSPYLAILPGIAIMLMVLSFVLLGNGLRDALDTKLKDNAMI